MRGQAAKELNSSPVRNSDNVRDSIISHKIGRLLHYGSVSYEYADHINEVII